MDINVRKQSQVQVMRLRGDVKIGEPKDSGQQTLEVLFGASVAEICGAWAAAPAWSSSDRGRGWHYGKFLHPGR